MSWHADAALLERYAGGETDHTLGFSVEAHVMKCGVCRASLAGLVAPERLGRIWGGVLDEIEETYARSGRASARPLRRSGSRRSSSRCDAVAAAVLGARGRSRAHVRRGRRASVEPRARVLPHRRADAAARRRGRGVRARRRPHVRDRPRIADAEPPSVAGTRRGGARDHGAAGCGGGPAAPRRRLGGPPRGFCRRWH